ncbi:MAG: DUF1572 family protein [Bacteroidia bacterium]
MTIPEITALYLRNTKRLTDEINLYPNEEKLWEVKGEIINPGGNLCLHLVGGLNHFIGATLGKTGYVRNRDAEFKTKNIPKKELLQMIMEASETASKTLSLMNENELQKEFPFDFAGKHTTEYYLVFFIAHFDYHLGQLNYHRRMV